MQAHQDSISAASFERLISTETSWSFIDRAAKAIAAVLEQAVESTTLYALSSLRASSLPLPLLSFLSSKRAGNTVETTDSVATEGSVNKLACATAVEGDAIAVTDTALVTAAADEETVEASEASMSQATLYMQCI